LDGLADALQVLLGQAGCEESVPMKGRIAFRQEGNSADFGALMVIEKGPRNGVVVLTNGQYGAPLASDIADHAIGQLSGQE
jgi:hypothetical protein